MVLRISALCAVFCLAFAAHASGAHSLNVQVGAYEGYRNFALGWGPAPFWSRSGPSHQELLPEISIGYADYDGHVLASRNRLWHVGGAVFFRWYFAHRNYAEIGAGPYLFTHDVIGNHLLSTHLQFGDSIGFAHRMNDKLTLGLRYTHFSNASTKRPNDGANFVHLIATYTF
jgi:lipid A 3-O-deacylase